MAELDHWHPVLKSEDLKRKPVAVTLCGREIVLFKTQQDRLGALDNSCPHRGMRLSEGKVIGERLVCPYHGWAWSREGDGLSPGNPRMRPCATRFEVVDRWGAIWIKNAGSDAPFPVYDAMGMHEVTRSRLRVHAPLELVLDNFTEVEHTGNVHALLGYPTDRLDEVETRIDNGDDYVAVYNRGPQQDFPRILMKLFQVEVGDEFVDEWQTRFSPIHTVYDHYWVAPHTHVRRPSLIRAAVFFNPITSTETEIFAFIYSTEPPRGRYGLNLLLYPMTKFLATLELRRDVALIEKLGDLDPTLKGKHLGRFDRALMAQRARIDRIYRGRSGKSVGEIIPTS